MSIKFRKLTRASIRCLKVGEKLQEHGIIIDKLSNEDIRYKINVMVDGERIHRTIGTESAGVTREQAERVIEQLKTDARQQRLNLPKGRKIALSFSDAATSYLERLELEGGKLIARKRQHLNGPLGAAFGSQRIDTIQASHIKEFCRERLDGGFSPASVNRELATLSHLLRNAYEWGWISRVPKLNRLREGSGRNTVLTKAESGALIKSAKIDRDPDLWIFIMVCLHTSMRHGEARRIQWKHIDHERCRIFVPDAKAGQRYQPMTLELSTTLKAQGVARGSVNGYVFEGGPGSKTGYRHTFRKAFQRAVVGAGLDPTTVTPHVLRHTAITRLVKANVDLPTIQRVSGHKTLSMVIRYTHIDGNHIDEAMTHLA
jgi:integrase